MRWAEKAASPDWRVDRAFRAELREHFSDAEVVELGMMIGQYLAFGRLLYALELHHGACELYVPDA